MSEKLLNRIQDAEFDDAASRDLDSWNEVSTDRETVIRDQESRELTIKHRGFGKRVLGKLIGNAPELTSVYDNDSTRSIIEQGRDGWGQVPDHIMESARLVRSDQERQKTSAGREEAARRDAVKQEIHDQKFSGNGNNNGW